jgi:diguanylate cyclase (GGDEF)-like protein
VFFVDLDRFKTINDAHGHRTGDELLIATASRLSSLLRPGDTLARLAGDEFVILCEDAGTPIQAEVIATRLNAALAQPFGLMGTEVTVTASIGVAFADRQEMAPEQILHNADQAMYRAKRQAAGGHHIFDPRVQHQADHEASLERDLRDAVARGELHLDYQPVVETFERRVIGVEALLRWAHPLHGLVAPNVLVPIAEQSGIITAIGRWVLGQAWTDRHRWTPDGGVDDFTMSVNVSPLQLVSHRFVDTVADVLAHGSTDPSLLTLEITESVFVSDGERALVVLDELKSLGVHVALDDFGTGYSSLSYLLRFPVDIVKIDQSFVAYLGTGRASRAIVASIIRLAHDLDMTVTAEGVETADQHQELTDLGCDACQGYYFARPMAATRLDTVMQNRSGEHGQPTAHL